MDNGKSSDPFIEMFVFHIAFVFSFGCIIAIFQVILSKQLFILLFSSLLPFPKEGKPQKHKSTVKWKTLDPEYLEVS